jgi:uncharacterized protein Usg
VAANAGPRKRDGETEALAGCSAAAERSLLTGGRAMTLERLTTYRLTTAEILYHLPDHPDVLQSYIWQGMDEAPRYPALHRFLEFWRRDIEGKLHSVRVGTARLVGPQEVRHAGPLQ